MSREGGARKKSPPRFKLQKSRTQTNWTNLPLSQQPLFIREKREELVVSTKNMIEQVSSTDINSEHDQAHHHTSREGKMAANPGPLTKWPWHSLGNYKYALLLPCFGHAVHTVRTAEAEERDFGLLFPFYLLLTRLLHDQLWISASRYQTARSKHLIQRKGVEFRQVDRERNWDDQAIFHSLLLYGAILLLPQSRNLPLWNAKGAALMALLHGGPVEFIYYWAHRALHHHFLYSRYHSHHHSSFVTEPITAYIHPFAEHVLYMVIFGIPILIATLSGDASVLAVLGYVTWTDAMNNLGHCNFEFIPRSLFKFFPLLKYLMYTPSFHSLHHSQVHTNFSLFMPLYDHIYGTADKASDDLYEASLAGREETVDVVHLTHLTTLDSIFHLRLGFPSLASHPNAPRWYLFLLRPLSGAAMVMLWLFGRTFIVEKSQFGKLNMETWAIPRYSFHYYFRSQKKALNMLIGKAILDANASGAKSLTLGLLNQSEELNEYGDLYIENIGSKKIKIVDGSTLAAAVVIHAIPQGVSQVLINAQITKTSLQVIQALCQNGINVIISNPDEFEKIRQRIPLKFQQHLVRGKSSLKYRCKVWLIDDDLSDRDQRAASEGTIFIPLSMFVPKAMRKDCNYLLPPCMQIPDSLENVHSCETWLPRRVMSAWRVAGIVHALEGWDSHECGDNMLDMDKVWLAALRHGFCPISFSKNTGTKLKQIID